MKLFPTKETVNEAIKGIVKKKIQPQIDKVCETAEEAEEYVENYIKEAGEEFEEHIEEEIEDLECEFSEAAEATTKLTTSMAAVPAVAASPFTAAAANEMILNIVGDTKSVMEKVTKISNKIATWIGSAAGLAAVTAAISSLTSSLEETQSEAESSMQLVEEEIPTTVIDPTSSEPTDIVWTWVSPCTMLTLSFEGYEEEEYPDGVTAEIDDTAQTLTITCDITLQEGTYNYTVEAQYSMPDEMDQDGQVIYVDKTKQYSSSIVK